MQPGTIVFNRFKRLYFARVTLSISNRTDRTEPMDYIDYTVASAASSSVRHPLD